MAFTNQSQRDAAGLMWGIHIAKSSATVPQSTTQDIFTVAGGKVLVRALVGEVTVAIGAGTTPDLQVQHVPTVGTTIDVATDVVIASDEIGTLYYVEGDGTALVPISSCLHNRPRRVPGTQPASQQRPSEAHVWSRW